MSQTEKMTDEQAGQQFKKLLVDIGPVLLFTLSYNVFFRMEPGEDGTGGLIGADQAIFWATGLYMAAAAVAFIYAKLVQKRLSYLLIATTVLVLAMGGIALAFHSKLIIYIKPTIMNLVYAVIIFGSLVAGRNVWKLAFGSMFSLPDPVWRTLAVRWALWFVFLAILNEVVWRTMSEGFWVNFKVLGVIPLTFVFAMANVPLTLKWTDRSHEDYEAGRDNKSAEQEEETS